ncbi:hypothetical protein [Pseudomonas oryzae]|uniref:Uncharacterized protein n=1 Tax=Pseudomonas oryzae TaxID=1392877 RepID=A0A1H1RQ62_9PSED|nr:hypothetical protein [Pseudomonas oryzae]SDS37891.1 hypothetical protein SAMN05216221_1689 [Pseudomonas oryzae]
MKCITTCAVVLLGVLSTHASAATDPLSKANRLPPSLEQKVQQFRASLEASGYEVARGYWQLWSADDCKYALQTVGYCYGNNPTAPYVMAFLPRWGDEFVDRSLHHAIAAGRRNMAPNYRLGEREALVVLAEMPPPARYFGIGTNVYTRQASLNTEDPVYEILEDAKDLQEIVFAPSPNPERRLMVASIGDSTNNLVIEEQSQTSWGQQRYFVISPDQDMAASMTAALAGVPGIEATQVFTEAVAPGLVNVGYGAEADDLITYIRYSMPNDEVLGEQWRQRLPLTILRVRATGDDIPAKPFDIPAYETKTANFDEHTLETDLANLVAAVQEEWQQNGVISDFRSLSQWVDLVGQHCLGHDGPPQPEPPITLPRGPMNCLGDTQDADYQISSSHHIDRGEVVAVVGTLGTMTGNATYTSLSVNWFPALVGLLNRDDPLLEGSAQRFQGKLSASHSNFYVYYFARDCTGLTPWCAEIPKTLLSPGEALKIIQRNYINPGTRRGPAPSMVLNPVSLEFDGNHRPQAN